MTEMSGAYVNVMHCSFCHSIWNKTVSEFLTWYVYFRCYYLKPQCQFFRTPCTYNLMLRNFNNFFLKGKYYFGFQFSLSVIIGKRLPDHMRALCFVKHMCICKQTGIERTSSLAAYIRARESASFLMFGGVLCRGDQGQFRVFLLNMA